ncbi:plastocyanin/azurin family copper-binding protein [Roseibacillus persicicus]|uniref:plastocyanin/azurin family copper-binding protein n=1 Tax=Roseibacillus persicicus TaxID=454148 RepID=UPI0028100BD8|nr:plastocyanin/azurin family copper-binding protein [Roseibacillus persicicus]MDQ8192280.1 plastocyanin/azurin family copper-binding protein [Roseibacillus persicicus]
MFTSKPLSTTLSLSVLCAIAPLSAEPNLANPDLHPYAATSGGREGYALASQPVNKFRLYDFYQRQADYYMAHPDEMPEVLPAYPGLDGGNFGHWGKFNQNQYRDLRWNEGELGETFTHVFRSGDFSLLKPVLLQLGEQRELSAAFDPLTLRYRAIWKDGFVHFDGFRWGTSRNAALQGTSLFLEEKAPSPADSRYLGFRRYGKRVVFLYEKNGTTVGDEPWAVGNTFYRRIEITEADATVSIGLPKGENLTNRVVSQQGLSATLQDGGILELVTAHAQASVIVGTTFGKSEPSDEAALEHFAQEREQTKRWTEVLTTSGTKGEAPATSPYAVDTIGIPFDNPYRTVMQLTSIGFLPNGEALIATLPGDIWKVSGLDKDLEKVTWSRFATGFNQPIGIHIDDDGIFVLDRGQIYRLHDENQDGEVDFYENYANDFGGYQNSHSHTFGLHRTADGSFHFTQRESILRTGPDRKTVVQGSGVRNCMGIGGSDDYFWVAPQEGTWTPASSIIEVRDKEFYGLPSRTDATSKISPPLCYIPRGIENSTGGMVEITSDKWGPYQGAHLGLSYGSGLHYLILRDPTGSRPQGAVVPLEGEFLAGSMRGQFHPQDGQLYLVGLDGWGDYSTQDGCFHRVRYTGGESHKPNGFRVHRNGIRVDFPIALDPATASQPENFFAQGWNYEYAKRYGSPEFSAKVPDSLGHDPVAIRSVKLLEGGKSLFIEMPELLPIMQLHIRMHLATAAGKSFRTDLFPSPLFPSEPFEASGLAKVESPATPAVLRIARAKKQGNQSGKLVEGERKLVVNAIGGLVYEQTVLEAKAGEPLALHLRNTDVMEHNLVIVKPGATKLVGEASFKMLNDPKAGEKHYVPDLPEVVAYVPIVDPGKQHVLHFRAPKEPGDYPYICTYPGHWQVMQGVLKVR